MRLALKLCTILLLAWSVAVLAADDGLQFPVQEFKLDNGMTFLVVERHTAPVFSGYMCVGAGSAYEKIGNIGSAHLLEHMMFKGSRDVGTTNYAAEKDLMAKEDSVWAAIDAAMNQTRYIRINEPEKLEQHLKYIDDLKIILDSLTKAGSQYVVQNEYDQIYSRNGAAQFNATTGYDFTYYYLSLPSNRLELWFNMEAGRLLHPAFREFFPERDVVSEERRQSVENSPDAKLFEQLLGMVFIAHPYQIFWEWQSEVHALTRSDLQKFFDTYYIPQRIAIAIVGDVHLDEVKKLAEEYFGAIPRGQEPEPIYTEEPPQPGERRLEVEFDANPAISIAYHKTAFDDPEEPTFSVIQRLLGEGRTSRLYKSLVLDRQLCIDIGVYTFPGNSLGDLHPNVIYIDAYPKEGVSTDSVENAVYAELNKLATVPVDANELTKIKNNIDADFVWNAYTNMGLAGFLAQAQTLAHDWHFLSKMRERLKAVTPEDIMKTAGKYFTKENRTVAILVPTAKGGDQ